MDVFNLNSQEMAELENLLQAVLKPVSPRRSFVEQLRRRLMDPSIPSVVVPKTPVSHYALLAAASLVSGTVLVMAGSRAVATFLGAVGVLGIIKRQVEENRLAPPPPTTA